MADQPESFDRQITQEILDDFTINPEKYTVLEFQEIELARNTQLLANQFAMIARDKKAKIPESVFISTFLPIFFGMSKFGNGESFDDNGEILMKHWVGVAGSLFSPVDVISSNGEVLFEVPPIADRSVLVNLDADLNLGAVLDHTALIQKTRPKQADQMRYESLASRIALLDDKGALSVSKKYLETWNKIADRYNLPHFVDTTIKTETNEETKVDKKEDPDNSLELEL